MSSLHDRIDHAIASVPASKAADEVLAEIRRTHYLVPNELIADIARVFGIDPETGERLWPDVRLGSWRNESEATA